MMIFFPVTSSTLSSLSSSCRTLSFSSTVNEQPQEVGCPHSLAFPCRLPTHRDSRAFNIRGPSVPQTCVCMLGKLIYLCFCCRISSLLNYLVILKNQAYESMHFISPILKLIPFSLLLGIALISLSPIS